MTLQAALGTAVRDSNATTAITTGVVPSNALLALFCHADADNGNATESLSISAAGGFTWTKNVQKNGSPGAVVAVFTAPVSAGSTSQIVSIADSQGSVAKSVFPVIFTDDNGGIPTVGKTSIAAPPSYTATSIGSWAWCVALGGAGVVTPQTGQTIEDSVSGSFDGGDSIATIILTAKATSVGQTQAFTLSGASQAASIEILPGTPAGGSTFVPQVIQKPQVFRKLAPRRGKIVMKPLPDARIAPTYRAPRVRNKRVWVFWKRGRTLNKITTQIPPIYRAPRVFFRKRWVYLRRGKIAQVPLTQITIVAPPYVSPITRSRREMLEQHRGQISPTPQAIPLLPSMDEHSRHPELTVRRGRVTSVPLMQLMPIPITRGRTTVRAIRRGRVWLVPLTQTVVVAPPYVPPMTRSKAVSRALRRGRIIEVPLTQTPVIVTPSYVPETTRAMAKRLMARRRGRVTVVTPMLPTQPHEIHSPRLVKTRLSRSRGRMVSGGVTPSSGNDGNMMFVLIGGLR